MLASCSLTHPQIVFHNVLVNSHDGLLERVGLVGLDQPLSELEKRLQIGIFNPGTKEVKKLVVITTNLIMKIIQTVKNNQVMQK